MMRGAMFDMKKHVIAVMWGPLLQVKWSNQPKCENCDDEGSDFDSVGGEVASDSRGVGFKASHGKKLYWTFTVTWNEIWKDEKKR